MKGGTGVDLILLKMVDESLPTVKFKYTSVPWKRCLNNIKIAKSDGCFSASFKESRLIYGHFPGTVNGGLPNKKLNLHSSSYSLYSLKNKDIKVEKNLIIKGANGKIASPAGYSIGEDLKGLGYDVDMQGTTTRNNFSKLIANRIEAVAALTLNGNYILANNPMLSEQITEITPPLVEKAYYLMFSKQFYSANPDLAQMIWNRIYELKHTTKFKDKMKMYLNNNNSL
jgi:polar amino acid transport system substrate-binding protein